MIPMDAFLLILAFGAAITALIPARRDHNRKHLTPTQWWNSIRSPQATGWQHAGAALRLAAKFVGYLAVGLFLAALVFLGESVKVLACTLVAIYLGVAFLLEHYRTLTAPPRPAHSGRPELAHVQ
ncbi:hypothetical protein ABT352_33425 [Streptosporangium sp. NPDC000563]|uniref:hypothetical protein n=1 Tax=Streptosporangium sp. NPDC000563 TaxID=3154366 RepID=UPI003333067C